MNNLIISISGAAHSGKTTFINSMVKEHSNVVSFQEQVRTRNIDNIDDIRKDPKKYLDFQIDVISAKIKDEEIINSIYSNKVVLIDRSLIDSYFYYIFYVDKSMFFEKDIKKYNDFLYMLYEKIISHINNVYNYTFLFSPITSLLREDKYTQKNLKYTQLNEYNLIKALSLGFIKKHEELKMFDITKDIEEAKAIIEGGLYEIKS